MAEDQDVAEEIGTFDSCSNSAVSLVCDLGQVIQTPIKCVVPPIPLLPLFPARGYCPFNSAPMVLP